MHASLPRTAAVCALTLAAAAGSATAQISIRTVALSGQTAPGMPDAATFASFFSPVLNHAGQIAFHSYTTSPAGDGAGIWSDLGGPVSLVARDRGPAPGFPPGTTYLSLRTPMINAAGQVAFHSRLSGPNLFGDSIWAGPSHAPEPLVRTGDAVPGMPAGATFSAINHSPAVAFNEAGEAAFIGVASVAQGASSRGIWAGNQESLRLVARAGAAAPGTPSGVTFDILAASTFESLVLNAAGRTVFAARITGPGVTDHNNRGIWSDSGGSLVLVARGGDAAPGTAPGTIFNNSFESPVINAAGQVAFLGTFTGPDVSGRGIWSGSAQSPSLIARTGDAAPGMPEGTTLNHFAPPGLNGVGQVAFRASFTGPTSGEGIWIGDQDSLNLVAHVGGAAPGTAPTTMFNTLFIPSSNNASQVAFLARLSGPEVTSENDFGIWATDPSGALALIVRTGDLFDVNDDPDVIDQRTVAHLVFTGTGLFEPGSGGEDGRSVGINDLGQLAFRAIFTDGSSGIFVATIPAPSAAPLLPLAALIALRRRR